jgi:radical SAM superfamily enzyme YgiQ (UPF0313 family)
MKILFSNPPWWEVTEGPAADGRAQFVREHQPVFLRQGIRAGSRWPFTRHAFHAPDEFRFGGYLPFPFFLAHAASYTERELPTAHVTLRDSIARGESYNTYCEHLADERYDFIVIETATPSWAHDTHLIHRIAALTPSAKVILTGTLDCTHAPDIFARHPNVCAIVQGEYDKQIAAVIRSQLSNPASQPRIWPHNLLTVDEMNASPAPMWDEACASHYWDACPAGQAPTQLQIWTSRGCPFKCIFCVWPAVMTGHDPDGTRPRKVRSYSPEYVEAHIRWRLDQHQLLATRYSLPATIGSIYLDDDTFNLTDKHTLAICAVMKRIGLPWSAMCRADTISHSTWRAMRESGCFGVKLGFESGSQFVVDHIVNKRLDLMKAETETLPFLQSLGLTVHTTWTLGLPGETALQQDETRAMIERLYKKGLHQTHQLSGTAEIEGTPLHTLRTSGHLQKYDGATLDATAAIQSDGQKKIETLR